MLEQYTMRRCFSKRAQLKFIIAFNEAAHTNKDQTELEILASLMSEFPYLTKVVSGRVRQGQTFSESVSSTMETYLSGYMLGGEMSYRYNADMARVMLAHDKLFTYRSSGTAVAILMGFIGVIGSYESLMMASGMVLLHTALVWLPLERLHAKGLRSD